MVRSMAGVESAKVYAGSSRMVASEFASAAADDNVSSVSSSVKTESSVAKGKENEVCAVSKAGSGWIVSSNVASSNGWVNLEISSSVDVSS